MKVALHPHAKERLTERGTAEAGANASTQNLDALLSAETPLFKSDGAADFMRISRLKVRKSWELERA
jgi:hypothetical protein